MYWLNSFFTIKSVDDLTFLANFYNNVSGELQVKQNGEKVLSIEWTTNPFKELLTKSDSLSYPYDIYSRLVGPDTVRAAAICVNKLNPKEFEHSNKNLILEWADYIDKMISAEMERQYDLGYYFKPPKIYLNDMTELALAIKLSKHCTHAVPFESGFIVTNPEAVYLTSVGLNSDFYCTDSLMFDKDDGFLSPFEPNCKSIDYLNTQFQKWKENGYQGKMSDYFNNMENID
ncbi:putative ORFan [Tupanvirus deep ocean]|uniref:ORFan n=2 Tax=Tupanvirus TaxID=2094720 RepID=A0AC62A9U3_9VIRU|nr:putative ORFan [Tupanvirus deep ocean]QKU34494.1 putative ORFan [Tupanvirus deep ocean]